MKLPTKGLEGQNLLSSPAVVILLERKGFATALPIKILHSPLKKKFEHPAVSKHSWAQLISEVVVEMRAPDEEGKYSVNGTST